VGHAVQKGNRYALWVLLCVWPPAGLAEEPEDLFDLPLEQLEQMVVTAQKRSENLEDVPLSISAFSGEDLIQRGVYDTQSLQIVTPGLVFNNTGTSAQPYLRGVGTRFAFAGLEPSVATYLDDRYVARAQATIFELADVERVEILRGPQGTLYGRNATGGAIRVVTRGVDDQLSGNLVGTVGDYDLRAASGTVNVPLSPTLGFRLTGLVRERNGYADNLDPSGVSELDDRDVWTVRGKLRWDATERISALLTLQHTKQHDNFGNDIVDLSPPGWNTGIAEGGVSGESVDEVATAIDSKINDDETSADLRLDIDLARMDLVSITTYQDFDQDGSTDADGTSTAVIDAVRVPQKAHAFSQELQLLSNTDGPWRWITGLYFFKEAADFEILLDTLDGLVSEGDQRAKTTAFAMFGQVGYELNSRWSLNVGARWSYEQKKATVVASKHTDDTLPAVPFENQADWRELTPSVTLIRSIEPGMLYATYARGFKSGGYNYPANSGALPLDPERLDMLELGWKTAFFAERLRVDGSVFYYDYENLQVTRAPDEVTKLNVTENAADAEAYGMDLDVAWLPTDWLALTAGLSLLDSKYKNFDASALVFNAVLEGNPNEPGMSTTDFDAAGEDLLRAPKTSWFASAEVRAPLGRWSAPVVVTYSWKDDYRFDFVADPSTQRLEQRSYGLLSARASLVTPDERWSLSVWGNNLTDEDDYYMDIVADPAGIRGSHGAPRTWGLDVGFHF